MKDDTVQSSSLLVDRLVSLGVIALAIVVVAFGWSHYPRPSEGGPLILGMAAALAVVKWFDKPAGRPLLRSTLAVMATILVTQAILQTIAALGWI